jgi:hypothetical protein
MLLSAYLISIEIEQHTGEKEKKPQTTSLSLKDPLPAPHNSGDSVLSLYTFVSQ